MRTIADGQRASSEGATAGQPLTQYCCVDIDNNHVSIEQASYQVRALYIILHDV